MLQQNSSWLVHRCTIIQTWSWPKWMGRNMLSIQWFNKLGHFGYFTAVFCDCSIPIYSIYCQHSGDKQAKDEYKILLTVTEYSVQHSNSINITYFSY
jgi:hypothetical protein